MIARPYIYKLFTPNHDYEMGFVPPGCEPERDLGAMLTRLSIEGWALVQVLHSPGQLYSVSESDPQRQARGMTLRTESTRASVQALCRRPA